MGAQSAVIRHSSSGSHLWLLVAVALVTIAAGLGYAIALGEMGGFFLALSIVGAIAVLFDFRIGAVLLVLVLPIADTNAMPHSLLGIPALNPFNLLLASTLGSYLMRHRIADLAPRPLLLFYVLPILAAGVLGMTRFEEIHPYYFDVAEIGFNSAFGYLQGLVIRPLLVVAAAVMIGAAVAKSQKPERFLVVFALSVCIIALVEIGFILASGVRFGALAAGSRRFFEEQLGLEGLHANDLGRLFAIAYGILLFVWWETKRPGLKTLLMVTLGLAAFALVLTFSRAAFLGFFLVNGIFLLWKFNARTMALALAAAGVCALLAPDYLYSRLTFGMGGGDVNEVSADRIDGIWVHMLPEVWKSPLWGEGVGSVMWSYPVRTGAMFPVGHPHNAYLEAVLDMGFIGLALLMAYFVHVWRGFRALGSNANLSPEMRGLFQGGAAALICFLFTGLAGSSLRPESEFVHLWLAIGFMYGMLARRPAG